MTAPPDDGSDAPATLATAETQRRPETARSGTEDTYVPPQGLGASAATGPRIVRIDPERYVIRGELGRGGMGRISIADDRALGRTVAIKEMLIDAPDYAMRFQRELALTARLQHPGIVTVHDGGLWPSGQLVYVMRLVSGDSLEIRIARCKTIAERISLVPHVIAAVDALAYAHSQGIIHRDLKPANLLVGDFGEAVVIDWGLAKDLRAPVDEGGSSSRAISNSAAATVVGDVIGTPGYMPPEQARGADVDERADVYALGALLYHVLAGVPPFRGRGPEALTAVLEGPPPPLAITAPGSPPDLVAIVERAMDPESSRRYPSAAELGMELKRFQAGKLVAAHQYSAWDLTRRWLRRRRAAVAVAAVALIALAIGAVISVRRIVREEHRAREALALAEANHTEAERRSADAERLIDFMVFQLHDKLQPIGRLDLLDDVARMMQRYYASRPDASGPDDQRKRARARRNLGNVLASKGDTTDALVEHTAALTILTALADAAPADLELRAEVATSLLAVAKLEAVRGQLARALDGASRAVAIAEAIRARAPTEVRYSKLLVDAYLEVASRQQLKGELVNAIAIARKALAIANDVAAHGRDRTASALLSRCHETLGDLLRAQGQLAPAVLEYRAGLAIDAAEHARDPDDASLAYGLVFGYLKVGDVLADQGDTAGALAMFRASLGLVRVLTERDPANTTWQRQLSVVHMRIGDALAAPGTAKAALASYQAARAIRLALTAKDPKNTEWQRDLLVSYISGGRILEATNQLGAARTEFERARTVGEQLATTAADHATARRDLVSVYAGLGRVVSSQGDHESGLRWLRAALAKAEQMVGGPPADITPDDYWAIVTAHEMIGDLLVQMHDPAGADAELGQAEAVARARATAQPNEPRWRDELEALQATRRRCCAPR